MQLELSNKSQTFYRTTSYSFSFRSSACRAVLRVVSLSSSTFSFSAEWSLVNPAFLISLAAASNKESDASSNPRDNGFFCIIGAQGFEPGELLLIRCSDGDILSRLIPYPSRCEWTSKSSKLEDVGISRSVVAFIFALQLMPFCAA